jgi:phosphatidylglycerophosphate synthase
VADRGISANTVTTVSLVLVLAALWLFAQGEFLAGLAAAWGMAFLDTVDGKLARVTLTSTRWGEAFDHGIDLIHPPFWYAAWWYGLQPAPPDLAGLLDLSLWIIVLGYLVGRFMEGFFLWKFKLEIHAWRRIDSQFRLITARRNPNVLILTVGTVLAWPDLAFIAVAAWTAISLVFHGVRIVQAVQRRGRGQVPVSWLSEAVPSR